MKYQEGLKETKDFLKTTPEPQMRDTSFQMKDILKMVYIGQ